MGNIFKIIIIVVSFSAIYGCKESERFKINYADDTPPGKPFVDPVYKPLYGGARIYFTPPEDRDVLTVNASYLNQEGQEVWFSSSYFSDSIDVEGFPDTLPKEVSVYAVDRAGNKSEAQTITVVPKEPSISRIARSIAAKGGFGSFYVEWENELSQVINIHVNYAYGDSEKNAIFTSTDTVERRFVLVGQIPESMPVRVRVAAEDRYGNISQTVESEIHLIKDEEIPKDKWVIPQTNDSVGGVPQGFWDGFEGRARFLIDGIIDDGLNRNFGNTAARGQTGQVNDGDLPANFIIDLGEEWEISRIITHQRDHIWDSRPVGRGWYYGGENVGVYGIHIWDGAGWDSVRTHKIPFPPDLPGQQYRVMAQAGDMAYLYPDDPRFSAPTRWFRYEAQYGFQNDYTGRGVMGLSEITLYGRKRK
ncbi:DUF4959 domain-containing protein [Parapedobacter sp. 2B3]|uniref:DUF4959 domain-containing protein n=1 Tax=Parapedobacter sp. 2B3 TaxID=3342381 RepID=UPI0035B5D419